ncbi:hypothetical protein F5Y15DRAFT_162842 [Xylariaceae sp. FL0016]|nr:hypothetical protein F5Y15DRAFT_162842 [Xylariaceae sp. FL0016]
MRVFPIVNKARKPKFELHLSIYDLNNVPLVAGTSVVKWHLPASIHSEHRGRTSKCSIDKINHRVTYNYSKIIPIRISIDRANNLTECPVEFEVIQEFPVTTGIRDEKICLGTIKLNLSEYVEESENFPRRSTGSRRATSLDHVRVQSHRRMSSSRSSGLPDLSPTSQSKAAAHSLEEHDVVDEEAEEGIVRRYLMQDSKVNSTLKLGILMVQIDGERNYIAPPLKTAPMFGGIAGIMTGEQAEDNHTGPGTMPSLNKSRDAHELQDMYRRSLAASWACQPGELPADECIEDIFSGGSGWKGNEPSGHSRKSHTRRSASTQSASTSGSGSNSGDEAAGGTLRPSDIRRMQGHLRQHSNASDKSALTVTGHHSLLDPSFRSSSSSRSNSHHSFHLHSPHHRRRGSDHSNKSGRSLHPSSALSHREDGSVSQESGHEDAIRSRSESLISLVPTIGSASSERDSGRGREGFRRPREIDEYEVRDDLVAWKLPGTVT